MQIIGDRPIRITYDGRNVELMSPSQHHEFYKKVIGWMLETIFEELNVPYEPAGSTTWRTLAHAKGLEADECYYLNNLERVRQRRNHLDLAVDPPPDLAVEIEISPTTSTAWRFTPRSAFLKFGGSTGKPCESSVSNPTTRTSTCLRARTFPLSRPPRSRPGSRTRRRPSTVPPGTACSCAWVCAELAPRR